MNDLPDWINQMKEENEEIIKHHNDKVNLSEMGRSAPSSLSHSVIRSDSTPAPTLSESAYSDSAPAPS